MMTIQLTDDQVRALVDAYDVWDGSLSVNFHMRQIDAIMAGLDDRTWPDLRRIAASIVSAIDGEPQDLRNIVKLFIADWIRSDPEFAGAVLHGHGRCPLCDGSGTKEIDNYPDGSGPVETADCILSPNGIRDAREAAMLARAGM